MSRNPLERWVEEMVARWTVANEQIQRELARLEEAMRAAFPSRDSDHRIGVLGETVASSGEEIERLRGELATARARVASLEEDARRIGRVLERQATERFASLAAIDRWIAGHGNPAVVTGLRMALILLQDPTYYDDPGESR
jgi:multidrug resistance efflux pump